MLKLIAQWALVIVLGLLFFIIGVTKFVTPIWTTRFLAWGYAPWMVPIVGACEAVGAVLLLIPRARVAGAVLLVTIMVGAGLTHLVHGEWPRVLVNAVFAVLLVVVVRLQQPTVATKLF